MVGIMGVIVVDDTGTGEELGVIVTGGGAGCYRHCHQCWGGAATTTALVVVAVMDDAGVGWSSSLGGNAGGRRCHHCG